MKTKSNSNSRLLLNKVTVVELNSKSLLEIKGGSNADNTGQTGVDKPQSSQQCRPEQSN